MFGVETLAFWGQSSALTHFFAFSFLSPQTSIYHICIGVFNMLICGTLTKVPHLSLPLPWHHTYTHNHQSLFEREPPSQLHSCPRPLRAAVPTGDYQESHEGWTNPGSRGRLWADSLTDWDVHQGQVRDLGTLPPQWNLSPLLWIRFFSGTRSLTEQRVSVPTAVGIGAGGEGRWAWQELFLLGLFRICSLTSLVRTLPPQNPIRQYPRGLEKNPP